MASPNRTKARRKPRQARAKQTIDVIMRATAQVLVAEGYDRASTNRIARVAGVSIGSLYQYFPNKQALVTALADAHVERTFAVVQAGLAEFATAPLPVAVPKLVDALIRSQREVDPVLHRVMLTASPDDTWGPAKERMVDMLRLWLETRRDELRITNFQVAAFVIVETLDGAICSAVRKHPAYFDDGALDRELTDLLLSYVLAD